MLIHNTACDFLHYTLCIDHVSLKQTMRSQALRWSAALAAETDGKQMKMAVAARSRMKMSCLESSYKILWTEKLVKQDDS